MSFLHCIFEWIDLLLFDDYLNVEGLKFWLFQLLYNFKCYNFSQTFCFSEEPLSVQIEGMGKVGLRSTNSGGMENRNSQMVETANVN